MKYDCVNILKWTEAQLKYSYDVTLQDGKVVEISSKGIRILCAKGSVYLCELVPEGKKAMDSASFVNGRGCSVGDSFN